MHRVFPFSDFLYLLQLEEYYTFNYFRRLPMFFLRRGLERHDRLNWTLRIKLTFVLSLALFIIFTLSAFLFWSALTGALLLATSALLIPVWVGLANAILDPTNRIAKIYLRRKAKNFVRSTNPRAKIIVVAGSFGKTTTKNFIYQLIRFNYRVQMVEGNINTPTGIAQWLLKNLDKRAEVILVEMDAYEIGEIAKSCTILPPDISVITNVGDQHLIRFGNKRNLANALLEVIKFSKENAAAVISESTRKDFKALSVSVPSDRAIHLVSDRPRYKGVELSNFENFPNRFNLALALKVAELLDIPEKFVLDISKKLDIPERRHQLSEKEGYKIIDDSYNISLTTGKYGVSSAKDLARKAGLKLVVVTGGIPESGRGANAEYGRFLRETANHLVFLETSFKAEFTSGFGGKEYLTAKSLSDAWEMIKKNFKANEVLVLIQPELTDLYY